MLIPEFGWFAGIRVSQTRLSAGAVAALIVAYPMNVVAGGALETVVQPFLGGLTCQSLLYSVWEQFLCIGIVLRIWFRERFNHQGWLAANMGVDSYAVYIFHPFVIVPLAFALGGITMPGLLKCLWVAPLALSFLQAHCVRRLPLARDVLQLRAQVARAQPDDGTAIVGTQDHDERQLQGRSNHEYSGRTTARKHRYSAGRIQPATAARR